jgi:hypothetical protein
MKKKLTLSIDAALVPRAKRLAATRGVSLSTVVESALRDLMEIPSTESFVGRWRGSMVLADRDDARFQALIKKNG